MISGEWWNKLPVVLNDRECDELKLHEMPNINLLSREEVINELTNH